MLARINRHYVPAYWDDFFSDKSRQTSPAVNVTEDEKEFRIDVAVPGLSRKDIKIDLENDMLTISSDHEENKNERKDSFVRREFSYNSFSRSFQLPESIDQGKIRASHDSGVLTVQLPKKKEVVQNAPKQIEIS